jgi:hypothetical protein
MAWSRADERRELYQALEIVLPLDIRQSVRGRRLATEEAARQEGRA